MSNVLALALAGDVPALSKLPADALAGTDSQQRNALFYAVAGGHVEAVQALLDSSHLLLDGRDASQQTALHAAALFDRRESARLLLAHGLLDEQDRDGRTALHLACASNAADVALLLLDKSSVGALDSEGRSAAHFACQAGSVALLEAVLARDRSLASVADRNGVMPLHLACLRGSLACANKLLAATPLSSTDASGATVLHYAAAGGNEELVSLLLSAGSEALMVDSKGNTALHFAARSGNLTAVERLLQQGDGRAAAALANLQGDAPAHLAAFAGHLAVLKRLQEFGFPRVIDGVDMLLHKAAFSGHAACITYLLSNIAVECRGSGGGTPLHKAAAGGSVECVTALLAAGANASARDAEDALPLHKACLGGHAAVAQLLKVKEEPRTNQGVTALHMAAASGNAECLRYALSAYKDSVSNGGFCTAHYAARNGSVALLKEALIDYPALLEAKTSEGLSVRDVAQACGHAKFVAALAALTSNSNLGFSGSNGGGASGGDLHRSAVEGSSAAASANAEMVSRAVALFNAKPQKGVQFLIQHKLVEDNPDSFARFLFETEALSKKKIGELISENDEGSQALANAFLRQLDFAGKDFDASIRLFLSKFMLPGEAQKIDRVMEMFASRFYDQNPDSVFANADTCYVLAFAVIMLNTDLFNPSIKKDKKMTKQQWQSHVRGVNNGADLPVDFVVDIYEKIRTNEIKMESETNMFARAGKKGFCMKQGGKIRTWKKRFFILSDHQLFYFKAATDEAPLGIIPLENLTVEREEKLVKWGFRLSSTDGGFIKSVRMSKGGAPKKGNHTCYVVGCATPEEQVEWMDALQQAIHRSPFYELLLAKSIKKAN